MKHELEQMDRGLRAVQDEEDFQVPADIKRQLAAYTVQECRAQIAEAKALGTTAMVRLGFAYMGLKENLKGKFKKTIEAEEGKSGYMAAWRAMCRAKAFLILGKETECLGIRSIEKLLSVSAGDVLSIRAKLIGASPENVSSITERELESAYHRLKRKKPKEERVDKPGASNSQGLASQDSPSAVLKGDDPAFESFFGIWQSAYEALSRLAMQRVDPSWLSRIRDLDLPGKLGRVYSDVLPRLTGHQEVTQLEGYGESSEDD